MKWNPAPRAQALLLEPSEDHRTSIIPICGSARSGKTTLALALISWAARRTSRPFAFVGLPDGYADALPDHIRARATNPPWPTCRRSGTPWSYWTTPPPACSSRDSTTTQGKMISRIAGIISHLGLTVLLTTQSDGVDLCSSATPRWRRW